LCSDIKRSQSPKPSVASVFAVRCHEIRLRASRESGADLVKIAVFDHIY